MDSQGKEKQNDFLSNFVLPFLSNNSALLKCTTNICLLLWNYLNLVLDTWISYEAGKMAPLDPPFLPAPMYHPSKVLCKDKTMKFPSHMTENRHRLKNVWWEKVWTRAACQWVLLQRCLSRSPPSCHYLHCWCVQTEANLNKCAPCPKHTLSTPHACPLDTQGSIRNT